MYIYICTYMIHAVCIWSSRGDIDLLKHLSSVRTTSIRGNLKGLHYEESSKTTKTLMLNYTLNMTGWWQLTHFWYVHPYFGVVWSNLRSLIFQIQVGWFNGPTMGGIIPASKSPNEAEIRVFGGWKNSGGGGATFLFLWKYFEKHITLPKFNVNFFSPLKVSDLDRK